MARELNRLTTKDIDTASCHPNASGPKLLADGGGLYLQIMPSGSKSWLFRFTLDRKPQAMGLGAVHVLNLAEARGKATEMRKLVKAGHDPRLERSARAHAQALARRRTFRTCAEEFIASIKREHRNPKAHAQWSSSLETYAYPFIGNVPVADIDVHMVRNLLTRDNLWSRKNETMSRVRGRIERILGWCAVLGYRSDSNPARYRNYLSEVLPSRKAVRPIRHHPSIAFKDLPTFVAEVRQRPATVSRLALELLILTATRTGEVIGATWNEIDFESGVWTIPAGRMKSGRVHRVPLSDQALTLLNSFRREPAIQFVFPGRKRGQHLSNMAMLQFMRKQMESSAVPHGFRSTFRVWCAEATEYPRELAEAALAHVLENKTESAYQRGDLLERRRVLMNAWASYAFGEGGDSAKIPSRN